MKKEKKDKEEKKKEKKEKKKNLTGLKDGVNNDMQERKKIDKKDIASEEIHEKCYEKRRQTRSNLWIK